MRKTFAEMSREEKNRVSHRGKAMAKIKEEFHKVLKWLEQRLSEEPLLTSGLKEAEFVDSSFFVYNLLQTAYEAQNDMKEAINNVPGYGKS